MASDSRGGSTPLSRTVPGIWRDVHSTARSPATTTSHELQLRHKTRVPKLNPSDIWRRNHPWAPTYAFLLNHPALSIPGARVIMGTNLRLLYDAAEAIGELPAGSAVLDMPCGGGIALRGVAPGQGLRYVAADIAPPMLERTRKEAARLGVSDQVETREADIGALPFADGEFDLVVSFTGLHCVPDPHGATLELARVTRPGGQISGSLFLADVPLRRRYFQAIGRASGLVGPSATQDEVVTWLGEAGFAEIEFVRSGDLGYFTGTRAASADR